jgi:hypothetical protein
MKMPELDLEKSPYLSGPAYRYIRQTDALPTTAEVLEDESPMAKVKLFDPSSEWTWYIAGYDPDTRVAWGRVHGHEVEVGSIDMAELVNVRGPFGLPIERDLWFRPEPVFQGDAAD